LATNPADFGIAKKAAATEEEDYILKSAISAAAAVTDTTVAKCLFYSFQKLILHGCYVVSIIYKSHCI